MAANRCGERVGRRIVNLIGVVIGVRLRAIVRDERVRSRVGANYALPLRILVLRVFEDRADLGYVTVDQIVDDRR